MDCHRTDRRNYIDECIRFLDLIWDLRKGTFFFLAARDPKSERWIERPIAGDTNVEREIRKFLGDHPRSSFDLYYCPNAFSTDRRIAVNATSTRVAWCDIDHADPERFRPRPTITIETSPGRTQGLWLFERFNSASRATAVSRSLTYEFGGDRGGWSVTKMLRLPGTYNHKPDYVRPKVKIVKLRARIPLDWPATTSLPRQPRPHLSLDATKCDAATVIKKYASRLRPRVRRLIADDAIYSRDRSRMIFIIVTSLQEAGATPDEIACVLWRSVYFTSKHSNSLDALSDEIGRILNKLGSEK
jgi:hypothetical protein